MKQGWEHKKLGSYIKEYSVKNKLSEEIPVYSVTNSQGFCKDYFGKEVASQDKSTYKIVPYGFFAYNPSRINVGSIDWQSKEDRVIVSPLYNVFSVSSDLMQQYLLYYLKSPATIHYIDSIATGTVRLNLKLSLLKEFILPIPSLSTQEKIVSELDNINELIRLKKEQLKDYDNLAQSIFYEMFGDPVGNEKGWEVKKLGEVCSQITDGTHNSPTNTKNGDFKYVTAKNIKKEGIVLDNITYVDADTHHSIYSRCNPEYGDILYIKDGATTGIATINNLNEEFSLLSSVALLKLEDKIINYYLKAVLNTPSLYNCIRTNMGGAAITRLTLVKIKAIKIPLPPLPLQHLFAQRIEQIERQKSAVQKSITDLETLLASRMQYWFE